MCPRTGVWTYVLFGAKDTTGNDYDAMIGTATSAANADWIAAQSHLSDSARAILDKTAEMGSNGYVNEHGDWCARYDAATGGAK